MTEVEFKIHELRAAADQFRISSLNIDQSVQLVRGIIEPLLPQLESGEGRLFAQDYHAQRVFLEQWMELLTRFALKLAEAGDDLEEALVGGRPGKEPPQPSGTPVISTLPPLVLPSLEAIYRSVAAENNGATLVRPQLNLTTPDDEPVRMPEEKPYLSAVNSPLYEEMLHHNRKLTERKAELSAMQQQREVLTEDLAALENRLLSYDRSADPGKIPRVQALLVEIRALDHQIEGIKGDIQQLDSDINKLSVRIERITPGRDADLLVIAALEGGETPEIIRQNTEGCVNYIVNRMPIPANIPRDAHLWDNMAARFDQYGIKMGETPLVGSVIVFEAEHSYADSISGHLMYVERVENGHIWITDNTHAEPVLLSELTRELTGPHIKFLYFPWHTQA